MKPKLLVTGGSGFIGSHLVETLRRGDNETTNLDIKKDADVVVDLRKHALNWGLKSHYHRIYHLAGRPWAKVREPKLWHFESYRDFLTNSLGTQRLLTSTDSDLFVFSSTANLYGNGRKFDEESPFDISSPYGYSKAIAERIIALSGRRYIIYRFGTVVGTRGRTFPNLLVWCAIRGDPVKIFNMGDTYRDLIDVRDIVSAMISADDLPQGIYNVSSGTEISGRMLAETVESEAEDRGYELNYSLTKFSAPGYVPYSSLKIDKILDCDVWKPCYTLRDTISSLFDYYEQENAIEPPRWDKI